MGGGPPWTGAETAVGVGSGLVPSSQYLAFSPEFSEGRTPSTSSSVLHRCSPTRVETKHAIRQLTRETVLNSHFLRLCRKTTSLPRGRASNALTPLPVKVSYRGGAPQYRGGALRTSPGLVCLVFLMKTVLNPCTAKSLDFPKIIS